MKSRAITIFFVLIIICFLGLVILSFSSVTAIDCVARVKGGSGTVEDPLLIEVEGNAGLTPFLDSLLPFRGIPAICLSYVGERFYIPRVNDFFSGKQKLARIIYLTAILLFLIFSFWVALRIAGKRIAIVNSRERKKEVRMNLYVGNLSFDISEEELRAAFEAFGQVVSATVIKDKYSGEPRGFGFVEMSSKDETQAAIDGLNNKELKGRTLSVGEARPRSEGRQSGGRPGGGRPGGGRPGGGYGGGYGGKRKSGKGSRRGARNAKRERKGSW